MTGRQVTARCLMGSAAAAMFVMVAQAIGLRPALYVLGLAVAFSLVIIWSADNW